MSIWRKFKKKGEALPNLKRRRCWWECYKCKENWEEVKTVWVHMLIIEEDGKRETRFICDDCEKDY